RAERAPLDRVYPPRARPDPGPLGVRAEWHLAGRRAEDRRRRAGLPEEPRRADRRVTGERQLAGRGEDPDRTLLRVVDEDRLGEAEVPSHLLASIGRDRRAVDEDAERVAA